MSDDERRRVAERLRMSRSEWAGMCWKLWLGPKFGAVVLGDGNRDELEDAAHRLADLIEPGESGQNRDKNRDTVQIESPGVQIEHECDRDALLALADEIEYGASSDDGEYHDLPATMVAAVARKQMEYARRIREALGVSDD